MLRVAVSMTHARNALIIGSTGLVGGSCLDTLLASDEYSLVRAFVRRPSGRNHPKLEEAVVDFTRLREHAHLHAADDVFASLGTTIVAAGSKERFRQVDHDATLEVASIAREQGAKRLALVSSVGAAVSSSSFYLRVKGETERDLQALGFHTLELFRPSFLMGDRQEHRRGEAIAIPVARALGFALLGPLRGYRAIDAQQVGRAMVASLVNATPGTHIRTYDDIVRLAAES